MNRTKKQLTKKMKSLSILQEGNPFEMQHVQDWRGGFQKKSSPTRFSSPREQRIVPGGRSRSNTGDLEVTLQQFAELRFIIENMRKMKSPSILQEGNPF